MFRTTDDGTLEFRALEFALRRAAPPPLTPERREALRQRILASLGIQEAAPGLLPFPVSPRWIAVPAGVGVAAAVIASTTPVLELLSGTGATEPALVDGDLETSDRPSDRLVPGELAETHGSARLVSVVSRTVIELGPDSAVRLVDDGDVVVIELVRGSASLVRAGAPFAVLGGEWRFDAPRGGAIEVSLRADHVSARIIDGNVLAQVGVARCSADPDATIILSEPGTCVVIPGREVANRPAPVGDTREGPATEPGQPAAPPVISTADPASLPVDAPDGAPAAERSGAGNPVGAGPHPAQPAAPPPGAAGEPSGQAPPSEPAAASPGTSPPPAPPGAEPPGISPAEQPAAVAPAPLLLPPPTGASGSGSTGAPTSTDPGISETLPDQGGAGEDPPGNSGNAPGHKKEEGEAPGNSGNAPGHNKEEGEAPGNSGEAPGHNKEEGEAPGNSGNAPGHNKEEGEAPGNSGDAPGHNKEDGEAPGNSGDAPGHKKEQGEAPGNSGDAPGHNKEEGEAPGNSGNATGHNKEEGEAPGNSGDAPGHNKEEGEAPGNSGDAPGHEKGKGKP